MTTPDPMQAQIAEALAEAFYGAADETALSVSFDVIRKLKEHNGLTIVPLRAQEPRGCPTPGACSCIDAQAALIEALELLVEELDDPSRDMPLYLWDAFQNVYKPDPAYRTFHLSEPLKAKARAALRLARSPDAGKKEHHP